jgi:hypothetical protein
MPPAMRTVQFTLDKSSKRSKSRNGKKKASATGSLAIATNRLQKELDNRLQHLLDKPD